MTQAVQQYAEINPAIIESLVIQGDLSKMNPQQRVEYYSKFCQSLGLNPLTQPFQILKFQGREILYAKKDATEQLRKIYGVSVVDMSDKIEDEVYIVKVKVQDAKGRYDMATGAVNVKGLAGENKANAIMKAETKAKRRATLSICGLGMLDESELETLPGQYETRPVSEEEKQDARLEKKLGEYTQQFDDTRKFLTEAQKDATIASILKDADGMKKWENVKKNFRISPEHLKEIESYIITA